MQLERNATRPFFGHERVSTDWVVAVPSLFDDHDGYKIAVESFRHFLVTTYVYSMLNTWLFL